MRRLIAVLLGGVLLLSSPGAVRANEADTGYATPEDAVHAYLTAVTGGELDAVLDTMWTQEGGLFGATPEFTVQLGSYYPSMYAPPGNYELYQQVQKLSGDADAAHAVLMLVLSLLGGVDVSEAIEVPDRAWFDDFARRINPSRLSELVVVDIGAPHSETIDGTEYKLNAARHAERFGANEQTERVALLMMDRDLFMVGFFLRRYGDMWKVMGLGSALAGTPTFGHAVPITGDEWTDLTTP